MQAADGSLAGPGRMGEGAEGRVSFSLPPHLLPPPHWRRLDSCGLCVCFVAFISRAPSGEGGKHQLGQALGAADDYGAPSHVSQQPREGI